MIKLGYVSDWVALPIGQVMLLPGEGVRRILIGVNSPGVASIYRVTEEGEVIFLAATQGLDEVEFYNDGPVQLRTESPDVWLLFSQSQPHHFVVEDPEVFTEIATRAPRNPEMERMMYAAQQNMERRLAQITAGLEGRIADAYALGQAQAGRPSGEDPEDDEHEEPEPAPRPVEPAPAGGKGKPSPAPGGASD